MHRLYRIFLNGGSQIKDHDYLLEIKFNLWSKSFFIISFFNLYILIVVLKIATLSTANKKIFLTKFNLNQFVLINTHVEIFSTMIYQYIIKPVLFQKKKNNPSSLIVFFLIQQMKAQANTYLFYLNYLSCNVWINCYFGFILSATYLSNVTVFSLPLPPPWLMLFTFFKFSSTN